MQWNRCQVEARCTTGKAKQGRHRGLQPATHLGSPEQPLQVPFFWRVYNPYLTTGLVHISNKGRGEEVNC